MVQLVPNEPLCYWGCWARYFFLLWLQRNIKMRNISHGLSASSSNIHTRMYFKAPYEFLSPWQAQNQCLIHIFQFRFAAGIFWFADGVSRMCNQFFNYFLSAICRRSNNPHPALNVPNSYLVKCLQATCSHCYEKLSWLWELLKQAAVPSSLWPGVRAVPVQYWLHTSVLKIVLVLALYHFSSTGACGKKWLCSYSFFAEESHNSFIPAFVHSCIQLLPLCIG